MTGLGHGVNLADAKEGRILAVNRIKDPNLVQQQFHRILKHQLLEMAVNELLIPPSNTFNKPENYEGYSTMIIW